MAVISPWSFARNDPVLLAGLPALRPSKPVLRPSDSDHAFALELLRDGVVAPHQMVQALSQINDGNVRLVDVLLSRRLVDKSGEWWLTLVGEVPRQTLAVFAQGLERRK